MHASQRLGAPALSFLGILSSVATTAAVVPGTIINAVDEYWGPGEFMYCRANGTIAAFALCVVTPVFDSGDGKYRFNATECPNTANLGRGVMVAMQGMASGDFGWFCRRGIVPIKATASVAADTAFGITGAGTIGAIANGKQIIGARTVAAATTTVAKTNCFSDSGSLLIRVTNSDGWFPGVYLSGTGVGSGAVVNSIDPSGKLVTVSVASTAQITGTVTATYNNATVYYNICHLSHAIAQGQVT